MLEEEVEETIIPKDPIPAPDQTTRLPTHTGTIRNSLNTKLSPMVLSIQDSTLPSMCSLDLVDTRSHRNSGQLRRTTNTSSILRPIIRCPPRTTIPTTPNTFTRSSSSSSSNNNNSSSSHTLRTSSSRRMSPLHSSPMANPIPPRNNQVVLHSNGELQHPRTLPRASRASNTSVLVGAEEVITMPLGRSQWAHPSGWASTTAPLAIPLLQHRTGFNDNKGRHHNHNNTNNNSNARKPGGPPSTPQTHHQKPDAASTGKKKKRKTNTLGLTPGDESEDDLDEEAKLSELIGADAPEPSDIAAWVAERKRNFPTQNRVKAKLAAGADRKSSTSKNGDAKDERTLALEKEQAKADKLRRELEKVESSLKRKREQQDAGDEMRDIVASSTVSPSAKSGDEKPEAMSSKPDPNANLPPPPKKADPTKHCKYYSTGGTCGKKGKCRFVHDPAVREAALKEREMNGGRMTLQQRLALNDKDQEDLTIIKTLAYLKEKGLMEAKAASNGASVNGHGSTKSTKSSLPPPPASGLPPQPPPSVVSTPTVRYQGWNLSGFGNTGVKSEH
ncbi:hypothetical protein VPNG_07594 [Cytospora leucostoma]|uniref:C3H1-type domain-containing protein n=1 Tax=Cytospora leucostoma TaxID=1230097 RepID=A0A423WDD6_9PEZI|nr:hypothetical protein VPNG_07594 [Cytospora leucostoma]